MLGNWCIEMFYNWFCSIVSCSVIKVVIEEPSCTGSSESIQVFKHFNLFSTQSSLYKADEIKFLDSLVVSEFRNHLCCSSLYHLHFIVVLCCALINYFKSIAYNWNRNIKLFFRANQETSRSKVETLQWQCELREYLNYYILFQFIYIDLNEKN